MFTIRQAFRSLIINNAGVSGSALGTNLFPDRAPEDAPDTYGIYYVISGVHHHHMEGAAGLANDRFQVDVYSKVPDTADEIQELIRLAIDGYRGTITGMGGNVYISRILALGDNDVAEPPAGGSDSPYYRYSKDFDVWYKETIPTL